MKKVFFIICVSASFVGNAQSKFGIHAGAIAADMTETYEGEPSFNGKSRISFRAGVHGNLPISPMFSIMPQLNYVSKGTKIDEAESFDLLGQIYSYSAKGYLKMNYLELPVHFVYNQQMKENSFFIGLGPSFSYGLGGDAKIDIYENDNGTVDQYTETADVKFDGKDNATANDEYIHYKALEVGMSIITGYQFGKNLFVNAQFNQGLSNINPDKTDGGKTKTMYVGLGLGFYFNK